MRRALVMAGRGRVVRRDGARAAVNVLGTPENAGDAPSQAQWTMNNQENLPWIVVGLVAGRCSQTDEMRCGAMRSAAVEEPHGRNEASDYDGETRLEKVWR